MRRTGAPTQADSRGRGRARGGCPGGEATPSLPPPRGGTRGQEPQMKETIMNQEKLAKLQAQVRIGGKVSFNSFGSFLKFKGLGWYLLFDLFCFVLFSPLDLLFLCYWLVTVSRGHFIELAKRWGRRWG
uniref:Uncharacterized protein n=1 Tax=Neovison vison TaxID=452646 RepID=A0A8C7BJQ4_NEOVI